MYHERYNNIFITVKKSIRINGMKHILFICEKTFTEFEHEKNIKKDDISHLFFLIETTVRERNFLSL